MTNVLRLLLVEDVPADIEFCVNALQKGGFSVQADICGSEQEFEQLILANEYDIVIADYNLDGWRGMETVEILQRAGKATPVIVMTGILGDEKAVDCLNHGAADYVLKDRLSRLPLAVQRAIDDNKLRNRSRLLGAAMHSVSEGVLIVEAAPDLSDARIVAVNDALSRVTGHACDDLIGKTLGDFQTAEDGTSFFANYRPQATLGSFTTENRRMRKNGPTYDAEWHISPILDATGRIGHHVITHRDITERKRFVADLAHNNQKLLMQAAELKEATSRAETATRAKSDFLACMSHEIRTPMNAIIGIADLLSETELTPQQKSYVEVFARGGEHLLVLINQLLDLSKIEAGKFDLERVDFDLHAVLVKATGMFQAQALTKGLSLSFDLSADTPARLVGDPHQLQQILTNLIGNAVKFTESGSVHVKAGIGEILSESECSILFEIADTGGGIPEEKQSMIFETFMQADSSMTRRYGGTGLGLSISKGLVERMKGGLTVESQIGMGSTFRFTAAFGVQEGALKARVEPAPFRVLLCDDSEDNAFLVNAYLTGKTYQVEHVLNGKAAVDRFPAGIFDVVLMDVQMPVMNGHEATRQIRQWETDHDRSPIPILALTAHAQIEEVMRCQAAGCTAFLSKPIRKGTLLAALAKHLPQAPSEAMAMSSEVAVQ
jgi:PAS domain S-box-containing protein